ncbi:uncharacterized protein LTR77_004644 [Saxophila tyrrhenica]|uniref:Major facilitator superfamily (MFS) profile domain-containing protein n=1 Tax=Saxophila tyrrhenica TaxID=1690608 RepID=A0AAV9PD87_9PEZI|nr:hypothetical protein LTR77_004644 [Saxophila tyrrhenica]
MVGISFGAVGSKKADIEVAQAEAPEFEKVHWWKDKNMRKLYFYCSVLLVASATTGYDGQMLNTSQLMSPWQDYFDTPTGSRLGLMNNAMNIGSIISLFIVPTFTDRLGRKWPIFVGCVIMIAGGFVGTFAQSWKTYFAGRLILGFGNSFAQMCSPILLTEICHPQHRAKLTAVYNCLWNLGSLFAAWIAWATMQVDSDWSWRTVTLLQIVPSTIQLAFIYWVPESPRWLVDKGRNEEALNMLAYYHAGGDVSNPTVQFEYREIRDTITIEKEVTKESSYLDFFRTKGNRWRLAIILSLGIISQYSGNALFSNYINLIYEGAGISDDNQKIPLNGGNTILSLIVSVTAAQFIDRFGRRPLFLTATTGMALMFVAWTISSAVYENSGGGVTDADGNIVITPGINKAAGYVQIPFVWLFGVFYSFAWSGLLVAYALEVLPFKLRAKGLMVSTSSQTNSIAWENLPKHWNFTLFYTLWICVELVFVYFVYVETKGPTLEEIARIFDGENAVAHIDLHQVEKDVRQGSVEGTEFHNTKD